jgi:hypothetical protein
MARFAMLVCGHKMLEGGLERGEVGGWTEEGGEEEGVLM